MKCQNPKCSAFGEFAKHHIFFKSQYYGKDRDEEWNKGNICPDCHRIIHHAGTDEEVKRAKELDIYLKEQALKKYTGDRREELEQLVKRLKLKQ